MLVGLGAGAAFWAAAEPDTQTTGLFAVLGVQALLLMIYWGSFASQDSMKIVMLAAGNGFAIAVTCLQFIGLWAGAFPWMLLAVSLIFPLLVVAAVSLIVLASWLKDKFRW